MLACASDEPAVKPVTAPLHVSGHYPAFCRTTHTLSPSRLAVGRLSDPVHTSRCIGTRRADDLCYAVCCGSALAGAGDALR